MSSSADPSSTPTAEYAEHLSHLFAIPSIVDEHQFFLGPIGNLDPTEFINAETNQIPFRFANPNLGLWKNTFKSWSSAKKVWPSWYMRVSASKQTHWEEIGISQALALTAVDMAKDEPMMSAATYFCGPTANWQHIAENIVEKKQFPLGKYLLGYLYQTLSTASAKIASGLLIDTGGPWWLLQIWLNLHTMKVVDRPPLSEAEFPRFEPIINEDGDEIQRRGEITSALMMDQLLNIPRPPLGSIENIKLRILRSAVFDRWWIECKKHLFHQSASMYLTDLFPEAVPQTTESSPPHHSESGLEIQYAPGILPNGGGLAPPVIGYHAPKTSTLLHGLPRVPVVPDASKKKRTKSAAAPSATRKKSKKQKIDAADDLPSIDPDVEQFLEGEELEEAVDEAAENISVDGHYRSVSTVNITKIEEN
uniref:OSJNBa0061A09.15 protein n=1 Tax=Oryza sativa subsp. japonica TaxID=39947 RepID=Q7XWB1_ORYSJ|nr:OSJNBa0061A09.15 [Oryza sativa Japonica Group]